MSMYYKTRASGGLLPMLRGRELGTACRNSNDLDPLLLTLSSDRRGEAAAEDYFGESFGVGWIETNPELQSVPPFALKYCKVANKGRLLAVADEEGYVAVVNTSKDLPLTTWPEPDNQEQIRCSALWRAHHNAIFDLCWTHRDQQLITASGDHTIRLWDTRRAQCKGQGMGHHGSVKCVDAMPGHDDILASAGRDGFLALWDTRLPGGPCRGLDWPAFLPVATVPGAHVVAQPRARQGNKRAAPAPTAVTALTFLPDAWLLATGGSDGSVKVWDSRKLYAPITSLFPDTPPPDAPPAAQRTASRSRRRTRPSPRPSDAPCSGPTPRDPPTPITSFARGCEPSYTPRLRGTCGDAPLASTSRQGGHEASRGAGGGPRRRAEGGRHASCTLPAPAPSARPQSDSGDSAEGRAALIESQAGLIAAKMSTARKRLLMTHLAAPGGASLAYACLRPPGDPHGVTGLAASPCGSLLAVSYAKESCVRLFDPRRPSLGPLHLLRGHRADGFYVKVAFSPCGDYLLCGSSDHLARVYRVPRGRDAAHRAIVLEGHAGEVSAVAWCQAGVPQLSTASDDGTVRVWSPSRSESRVSRSYAADVAQEAAPVDVFTPGFRAPSRRSTDSARVAPSPGGSAGVAAPATTPMSGGPIAQERPDAHGATPPMLQVMSLVSAGADARERVGGERGEPRTPVAGAGGPELQRGDVWAGGTTPGAGEGAGGTGKEVGGSSADGDALRTVAVRPVAEGERTRKRARQSTLELFFCSAGRQADQAD